MAAGATQDPSTTEKQPGGSQPITDLPRVKKGKMAQPNEETASKGQRAGGEGRLRRETQT